VRPPHVVPSGRPGRWLVRLRRVRRLRLIHISVNLTVHEE
jgi:hypothetical protein